MNRPEKEKERVREKIVSEREKREMKIEGTSMIQESVVKPERNMEIGSLI